MKGDTRISRRGALMAGATQTVDQVTAKIRAQCIAVGRRAVGAGIRFRVAGREAQYFRVDELRDQFFLVFAERLQFKRVVGA